MSSVDVSRPNCDVINVSIEQTGDPEVRCFFRKPLLDESRKYVLGVSGLTVPMMDTRLLPGSALVNLLFIKRRNAGQNITDANQTALNGNGVVAGVGLGAVRLLVIRRMFGLPNRIKAQVLGLFSHEGGVDVVGGQGDGGADVHVKSIRGGCGKYIH